MTTEVKRNQSKDDAWVCHSGNKIINVWAEPGSLCIEMCKADGKRIGVIVLTEGDAETLWMVIREAIPHANVDEDIVYTIAD